MSSREDSLGDRMKGYETVPSNKLIKRMPVIIRLDGKSFHTWTKQAGCQVPYDENMIAIMNATMEFLCNNIQNCVFGYTQSDEISLLLTDWATFRTSQWFDGKIQKIVSVAASLATGRFNQLAYHKFSTEKPLAFFDARAFNVTLDEVSNYFLWRQQDATRNSIQSHGQSMFSHKQLHKKSCNDIQAMMLDTHDFNWNDVSVSKKRGCCFRHGMVDTNIPIFKDHREYIETLL